MNQELNKNILIAYKGGGYDGCFWEYNFAFYDENGKFFPFASSGETGFKSEEDWVIYQERENERDWNIFYLPQEWDDFEREYHESLVMGVGKWLMKHTNLDILIFCSDCGRKEHPECLYPTGIEGMGGTMAVHSSYVCEDCYSSKLCAYCGEYNDDSPLCGEGFCLWCHNRGECEKEHKYSAEVEAADQKWEEREC